MQNHTVLPPPLSRRRRQAFDEESRALKQSLDEALAQVDDVLHDAGPALP